MLVQLLGAFLTAKALPYSALLDDAPADNFDLPQPGYVGSLAFLDESTLLCAADREILRWNINSREEVGARLTQIPSDSHDALSIVLEVEEMQQLLGALGVRERAMVFLDMALGLRRGELAGLEWEDVNFEKLYVDVTRSVVDQQVGNTKTEVSRKPVPIDSYLAKDLLMWHEQTPYRNLSDWVFATDSRRAGAKRGKQPLWLSTVMRYHIQPKARNLGIAKNVSWHTFRHTLDLAQGQR